MSEPTTILVRSRSDEVAASVRAAEVLDGGGLVALPTETLYGLAARADLPEAVAKLAVATGRKAESLGSSWHTSPDRIGDVIASGGFDSQLHRRALDRLAPGPVRFVVPIPAKWPLRPGIADDGTWASVRILQDSLAAGTIARAGGPVVINRLGTDARRLPSAVPGASLLLDAGAAKYGKPATALYLTRNDVGGAHYRIEAAGTALDERFVQRRLIRTILFACTGNTCRSPMAMAIAADILSKTPPDRLGFVPTASASAGVSAAEGEPASRETGPALRAIGIDPGNHRATRLTAAMVADAEVVYVMTQSHARAVRSIVGVGASGSDMGKIRLLDPAGDIEDPFGGSQRQYDELARRLRDLVAARVGEWMTQAPTVPNTTTALGGTK